MSGRLTVAHYLATAFGFLAAISALWSPAPTTTLIRGLLFLLVLLFAVETARIRWSDKELMARDLRLLFWLVVIVSAAGLILGIFGVHAMWGPYDRFKGMTANATVGAWLATLAFPLGYSRILLDKGRMRVWLIVGTTVLGAVIVVSGTRGAMLGLIAAVLVVHLLRMRSWIVGVSIAGAILILLVAMTSGLLPFGRVAEPLSDVSSGRFGLWSAAIDLWWRRPIGGWGFGSTSALSGFTGQNDMSAHDAYLSVLIETGVVGFIIFTALLVTLFARRGLRVSPGIVAAAVAVLVNGAFESSLVNLGSPVTLESWLILGATLTVGAVARPGEVHREGWAGRAIRAIGSRQ
jgi:O-antigen ligase